VFFQGSRYANVGEHDITDGKGRVIRYKEIRFLPEARARFSHILSDGERLDHIAYRFYWDPETFWRICDANLALWPDDLISEAGRTLLIPPPEG
jgi:hypothetical protein